MSQSTSGSTILAKGQTGGSSGSAAASATSAKGAKTVGIPAALPFPPYGLMNDEWRWDLLTRRVPAGLQFEGRPATADEWSAWLHAMAMELADVLWPRFDAASSSWLGAAAKTMLELTRADLELMVELGKRLPLPATLEGKPLELTHLKAFEIEDEARPTDPRYASLDAYVPRLAPEVLDGLKNGIKQHLLDLGPAPLRLKELMQRPRPYQVAPMVGQAQFRYQHARSAVSPSMVSGHAMQGLMGRCAGFMRARRELERVPGAAGAVEQYAVDVGDRRVYAGVHYPSDNLSSWLVSLRLAGPMFGNAGTEAHAFMARAIGRSPVLEAMREHARGHRNSPYAGPLQSLDAALQSPPGIEVP